MTLVPWIAAAQELKTKPTQHSVKELRELGIQPDILLCRCERFDPAGMKEKIALFCDVDVRRRDYGARRQIAFTRCRWGLPSRAWTKSSCGCSSWTPARAISPMDRDAGAPEQPARRSHHRAGGQVRRVRRFLQSLKEALLHGGLAHS